VEHGVCGLLSEVGNIDEMANNAIHLCHNDDLRKKMGVQGRARTEKMFTVHHIVPQYERLYMRALHK
jgi:L-malate glycosyltransferase